MKIEKELYMKISDDLDDNLIERVYTDEEFLKSLTEYIKDGLTGKGTVEIRIINKEENENGN